MNLPHLNVSETSLFGNHQTLIPFEEMDLSLSNGEESKASHAEREASGDPLEQYSLAIQHFPFSPETVEPFRILHQRWRV
jgi:hypothetical protein